MRLLQRYIFFELLRLFLSIVSVVTLLLVFVGVFREASERGLGPVQIFQVLPYVAPSMLPFTIPATLLLTVCVVYGRIASDNEVTAAKAAGINVMALLNPALLLGALLTVGAFSLTNHVIPWAARNIEAVIARAGGRIFLDVLSSQHQVNDPEKGFSITVARVDGNRLVRPIFKYAINNEHYIVLADEAVLDFDLDQQEVVIRFNKALVTLPGSRQEMWLESHTHRLPLQTESSKLRARSMTIREITTRIAELKHEQQRLEHNRDWAAATALMMGHFEQLSHEAMTPHQKALKKNNSLQRKLRTEMHSRFAMAGSCLLFVLLGAPYSILQARQQFLTNFIMCFMPILLVYYPVMFLMMNLSKSGAVQPWWSMWIANILIAASGLLYLRRVVRH